MNNYKDEYGIQDMSAEAQQTLELMSEKLDTDCADREPLQFNEEQDGEDNLSGKDSEVRDGKARAGKCNR